MKAPSWSNGNWKADCDVCGRTYKASELQMRWDGLMCCPQDWEIRQPQDFVRGVADNQLAPWTRPEPSDSFIPFYFTYWYNALSSSSVTIGIRYIAYNPSVEAINTSALNSICSRNACATPSVRVEGPPRM